MNRACLLYLEKYAKFQSEIASRLQFVELSSHITEYILLCLLTHVKNDIFTILKVKMY